MKLDADAFAPGSVRRCDVCVIGSGAAGITLARQFVDTDYKVILLEGGSLDWNEKSQNAYKAESVTSNPAAIDPTYPEWSRLRYFGGSTNHWGGWCRPFEAHDFALRPWISHSGWPIERSDVEKYYDLAAHDVEIQPFLLEQESQPPMADANIGATPFRLKTRDIESRYFHYSPPTRFADLYRDELFSAPNIDVTLNGSACLFDLDEYDNVQILRAKNSRGEDFQISARYFVLACGGLENPRLLLNSNHQRKAGLGNAQDMVGRCFMEHPHATIGLMTNIEDPAWHAPFVVGRGTTGTMQVFTTSPSYQALHELLNYSCELHKTSQTPDDVVTSDALNEFFYGKSRSLSFYKLYTRSEMAPRLHNRVSLGHETDHLGLRRLKLNVQFDSQDLRSLVKSTEAVIRALSAQGLGRGKIVLENDEVWSKDLSGGCHHMGTTRMSNDPIDGVVDRNCKVHELRNLYVAGSSVFATSGFANPTLTIVALAHRLGDHLKELL